MIKILAILACVISTVLAILYDVAMYKTRKDSNNEQRELEEFVKDNGIVDIGSSMDERGIYVCSLKFSDDE